MSTFQSRVIQSPPPPATENPSAPEALPGSGLISMIVVPRFATLIMLAAGYTSAGGADGDQQFTAADMFNGRVDDGVAQVFAEPDHAGADVAAAVLAGEWFEALFLLLLNFMRWWGQRFGSGAVAGGAAWGKQAAIQVQHGGGAGAFVQVVQVLRDDSSGQGLLHVEVAEPSNCRSRSGMGGWV